MPNLLKYLSTPEYFLRPRQAITRMARIGKPVPELATVRLPWKAVVTVHTCENVGREIYFYGIFDKTVPEAIWRLLERGETAVDIGANIGQNSSVMSARAGSNGRVLAFEPHPGIFNELKANHKQSENNEFAPVQLERVALGDLDGEAALIEVEEFSRNRGAAVLGTDAADKPGIKVPIKRLDSFVGRRDKIGVCKIDVEGHELAVLKGAQHALERRAIRDIIFEDFDSKPSPVTELLTRFGFTIFELHQTWLKPRLVPMRLALVAGQPNFSFNYLATLDPARAVKRFRSPGWRCLLNL